MALGYGEGSIAGVALVSGSTPIQAILDGGENLKVTLIANTEYSLNGNPQTQVFDVGVKGAQFSIRFPKMPRSVLDAVIAAVEAALSEPEPFTVVYDDGVNDFDLECTVANSRGDDGRGWISEEPGRIHQQNARNVVMRFITISSN